MVMEEEAFLLKSCFDGIIVMKLNVSNDYFFLKLQAIVKWMAFLLF